MKNKPNQTGIKTLLLTSLALLAFAANSVLCRLALGEQAIDASSFTIVRLLSAAVVLLAISLIRNHPPQTTTKTSWIPSLMLFMYAISFSYAYITLQTATGALILFGSVQITMILISVVSGGRLHLSEWLGVLIAFSGFVYLVIPEITTPSISGFVLMTLAGVAWGTYTLMGRGSENPLDDTTRNFLRTIPMIILVFVVTGKHLHYSSLGIILAIASGAIASGIGYTIWYMALAGLSATQAAVVQLSVPVIAGLGGVIFVSEVISLRLTVSALMILGGILLTVWGNYSSSN